VRAKDNVLTIRKTIPSILSLFVKKRYHIEFSYVDEIYDAKKSQLIKGWVLLLPGAGCSWAKKSGGCSMCGFNCRLSQINRGKRSFLTKPLKNSRWVKTLIEDRKPSNLTIYSGGSFLNDGEIPRDLQERFCVLLSG